VITAERDIPCVYLEYSDMTIDQRKHFHLYHSQLESPTTTFHWVLKTLGMQYFTWEILDSTEDEEEAKELLKYYIMDYKADKIGYNMTIDDENPRFGDHRTWNEIHGKEKADEIRRKRLKSVTGHPGLSAHMKKRLETWNPMDDPKAVEKVRQSKIGVKNPKAVYDYYLTKKSGEEIKVECLREFCRRNPQYHRGYISKYANTDRGYKDIAKIVKKDKVKVKEDKT